MKVVILAGGRGTRLAEETEVRPKPMVTIGEQPILWHIMKLYAHHGFHDFLVALGYKGEVIKRYFVDYYRLQGNLTVDMVEGKVQRALSDHEAWVVNLVETGMDTNTGGRIRRLGPLVSDGPFLMTYGDGVANVDIKALVAFHKKHGKLATVTAVRPPARYGGLVFEGDLVAEFTEKPQVGEGWINGGFMVLEPGVLDYLPDDAVSLEAVALERLAADGQLAAYKHDGFWQCMDTMRDRILLEGLWEETAPPWKVWP